MSQEDKISRIKKRVSEIQEKLRSHLHYGGSFHTEPFTIGDNVQHGTFLAILELKVDRNDLPIAEHFMRNYGNYIAQLIRISMEFLEIIEEDKKLTWEG